MPNVFFVTQGKTYSFECRDGYIWAPNPSSPELKKLLVKNTPDRVFWRNVELVKDKDVIIHYAGVQNGGIYAISQATTNCYKSPITEELFKIANMGIPGVGVWPSEGGRRVDCEYVELRNKMQIKKFRHYILDLKSPKYRQYRVRNSAFNVNGGVNQGYLYELEKPLAYILIDEAFKCNPDLKRYDFIVSILSDLKKELQ